MGCTPKKLEGSLELPEPPFVFIANHTSQLARQLKALTVNIRMQRNDETLYTLTTFAGFIGGLTG